MLSKANSFKIDDLEIRRVESIENQYNKKLSTSLGINYLDKLVVDVHKRNTIAGNPNHDVQGLLTTERTIE